MSGSTGTYMVGSDPTEGGRRKRRRLWVWPLLAVVVLGIAAAAFFIVQGSRAVALDAISPPPDSVIDTRPVSISCELSRFVPGKGVLTLTVDGKAVSGADLVTREGLVKADLTLADGPHTVALAYESGGVLSHRVDQSWKFSVDTAAPTVSVGSPAWFPSLTARNTDMTFTFSEPATATLTLDGAQVAVHALDSAAPGAKATVVADEGEHVLALTATDKAGNVTTQKWDLVVDYQAPQLSTEGLPDAEVWKKQTSAAVTLTVSDFFADQVKVAADLDGQPLTLQEQSAAAVTQTTQGKKAFGFETGTLAEGTHSLDVSATDPAGHVTTLKREFLVDTSSTFGARPLKSGAEGEDVKQLQRILKLKGVYQGDPTGTLDDDTATAVAAFNSQNGLTGGEVVTVETLKYLLGYIRIDVSERKLYLYSGDGQLVKTYGVAVGMPAHPTPIGTFRIITKQKNPVWNPPDSAWAAGMGPIPPGPGNPLGTRWMGLNSPGIGMHGTPAPSSIGTAASHGCIRMKIPDAEDLFDRVFVGTPVQIVA